MAQVPVEEYRSRISRARKLMVEVRMEGLIITEPMNYYYFTGHKAPIWMKSRPNIFILPIENEPTLITWSGPEMFARLFRKPFPSWVEDRRIYPEVPFTAEKTVDWGIKQVLCEKKLEDKRLGIELGQETWMGIPVNDFMRLKAELPKATFIESGPVVWGCRMIKSEWEINCARKACEIGGRAWKRCLDELREGISVKEIQTRINHYYIEEGADMETVPVTALGATGPGNTFKKGDILYLDGGPSYSDYKMDYTRRAVFGPPSERQKAEHNGMWEILFKVMDKMKPGVSMPEIFEYSQSLLAQKPEWRNYSDHPAKRIGHGIGLDNEPPAINAFDQTILAEGMMLTPEPKIETVEGLLNPEEQIVITKSGYELLSRFPSWELFTVEL